MSLFKRRPRPTPDATVPPRDLQDKRLRPRTRRAWLRNPIPIIDRYVAMEMITVVFFCSLGFVILILGNNFYANAEFLFSKTHPIPPQVVAMLSLLEAPASMVRSLPIATTFGVMLAMGRLGRDSELIAMRSGGASLGRILIPVLVVGLLLSGLNYWMANSWLKSVNLYRRDLQQTHVSKQDRFAPRNVFFRDEAGRIIYTPVYDKRNNALQRPFIVWHEDRGTREQADDLLHVWTAIDARFDGDTLIVGEYGNVRYQKFAWNPDPRFNGWELWSKEDKAPGEVQFDFPEALQNIDESEQSAEYQSAADISETAARLQTSGRNPIKLRFQLAAKYATPVACIIFAFVAFIFGIVNPRREKFSGVFYALMTIFWYYIVNAILKNLGENGFISPPELAAWGTNILFLVLAVFIFIRMR